MAKDFSKRTKSAMRYAGTSSGFMNDFLHISGAETNYQVTPAGGYVLHGIVVNTIPASGAIIVTCGSDIVAEITPTAPREFKYSCYMYDALKITTPDTATDITVIFSKG